nr:MAG TPA: hypothetical protein [Caudoviricetes sp.]
MIYTKEPANIFYMYVSAARADRPDVVNLARHNQLKRDIMNGLGMYGEIVQTGITGYFREAGQEVATEERTIKVACRTREECICLAQLVCRAYQQDCALVIKSQTHSAALMSCPEGLAYKAERLNGSLQQVDAPKGECYSVDANGAIWEVV